MSQGKGRGGAEGGFILRMYCIVQITDYIHICGDNIHIDKYTQYTGEEAQGVCCEYVRVQITPAT